MNRYLAEAIGTFCLVFAGCGALVVDGRFGGLGHVGVSLVFGLVVMAMIYAVGHVSGAHLNPAVTIGFCAARRLPGRDVVPYVVCQSLGALVAAFLLRSAYAEQLALSVTAPYGGAIRAFGLEVVLTFILMFVILSVSAGAKERGAMAGVAVGGTVALGALIGGPVSGASMNPARSLGPAVVAGELEHLWIYLLAPVSGACLARPLCGWALGGDCCRGSDRGAELEAKT